jgi:small subunit ribosomal protein S6
MLLLCGNITPVKNYELMYIQKSKAGDESSLSSVVAVLESFGGKVVSSQVLGKKKLAYKIKGHTEGVYILINFLLNRENLKDLQKKLVQMEFIIRSLITVSKSSKPEKQIAKKKQ